MVFSFWYLVRASAYHSPLTTHHSPLTNNQLKMLTILLMLVFFVCLAMLVREGIWSNLITLLNTLTAGVLAVNYFEPLATWLESQMPTYTYVCDFLALWIAFAVAVIVMRVVTDQLSKTRVKFKAVIDSVGGVLLALWIGWVMVGFTAMTLHTAPLARHFLGFYETPTDNIFLGTAPDRQWLGLVQSLSAGSLAVSAPPGQGEEGLNVFDPDGEYILKYSQRRAMLEQQPELRVRRD